MPRSATKLPLHLNTYKFLGGEPRSDFNTVNSPSSILFSGPVQLDELESQNIIKVNIDKDSTYLRMYGEHEGLMMTLFESTSSQSKQMAVSIEGSLFRMVHKGEYTIQVSMATTHGRKHASLTPPEFQLTVMTADSDVHGYFNKTWEETMA